MLYVCLLLYFEKFNKKIIGKRLELSKMDVRVFRLEIGAIRVHCYLQLHDEVQVVGAFVDVLQSYDVLMLYPGGREQKTHLVCCQHC